MTSIYSASSVLAVGVALGVANCSAKGVGSAVGLSVGVSDGVVLAVTLGVSSGDGLSARTELAKQIANIATIDMTIAPVNRNLDSPFIVGRKTKVPR